MSSITEIRDPNVTPPMGQAIPLGFQHVLAMFASNVTPSIIIAGAAGLAFGGPEQVYLIQMAMLFAGVATLIQKLQYGNTSDNPVTSRTINVKVNDGDGGVGLVALHGVFSGCPGCSVELLRCKKAYLRGNEWQI